MPSLMNIGILKEENQPHEQAVFLNELKESELLIISSPVYVDLLPAPDAAKSV